MPTSDPHWVAVSTATLKCEIYGIVATVEDGRFIMKKEDDEFSTIILDNEVARKVLDDGINFLTREKK